MNDFVHSAFGLAATIVGLALAALVIKNAQGTSQVIGSTTTGFANVLTAASRG